MIVESHGQSLHMFRGGTRACKVQHEWFAAGYSLEAVILLNSVRM